MNGSRLQPEDKEKWLKFWSSMNMQEFIGFGQAYNEDSDVHNAFKARIGTMRAPTSDEYAHNKTVRKFIKALGATKARMKKCYREEDYHQYLERQCNHNCLHYMNLHPDVEYKPVFGFRVWTSPKQEYLNAEGHCWLTRKDGGDDIKHWVDPTPFEDATDTRVLLVACDNYLTPEERDFVFAQPHLAHLPSIMYNNSRVTAGCKFTDSVFLKSCPMPKYGVADLRLLKGPVNDFEMEPKEVTPALLKRLKKDKEFWAWRQQIMEQGEVMETFRRIARAMGMPY